MIRFYDLDFNLLGETDKYSSLQFNHSWYGCGDVEIHLNRYVLINANPPVRLWDKVFETITDMSKELIVLYNGKAAIVHTDSCSFNSDGKGSEELVLLGKELKYLTHRAVVKPYEATAPAETIIKAIISANQLLPNFTVETNAARGNSIYYKAENYPQLDAELESIATANDVGWWYDLNLDTKTITAKFSLGVDRTLGTESPVLFRQGDNLDGGSYTHSDIEYCNVVIAKGKPQDDTVTNVIKTYGTATGFQRREIYKEFDAIVTTDANPFVNLDSAVQQYLDSVKPTLYIDAKPTVTANRYGIDYNLGDLVTLQAFDLTQNVRITNVKEIEETGKPKMIELTFGKSFPTLPNIIYREITGIKRVI